MVNFGLLAAEIVSLVWGTPANFNGSCVLAALLLGTLVWASAKLCGVEQTAPSVFDRAAIRWGIGRHSSCILKYVYDVVKSSRSLSHPLICLLFTLCRQVLQAYSSVDDVR